MAKHNPGYLPNEDEDGDVAQQQQQQEQQQQEQQHEEQQHEEQQEQQQQEQQQGQQQEQQQEQQQDDTGPDATPEPLSPEDLWCSKLSPYTYCNPSQSVKIRVQEPKVAQSNSLTPLSLDQISQSMLLEIENDDTLAPSRSSSSLARRSERSDYRSQIFGESALSIIRGDMSDILRYELVEYDRENMNLKTDRKSVLVAAPPIGHFADVNWPEDGARRRRKYDHSFADEPFHLFDKSTLFGQVTSVTGVEENQRITDKFNEESVKNGFKILDSITAVPLSKFWQVCTEVFLILLFFANIAAQIYDIVLGPEFFYYKITALVLSVLENFVICGMALASRRPKFKNAPDVARQQKHQQYAENILHELLLYPLIVIAVMGFANDKLYNKPEGFYGWILILLLCVDVIDLIWTQTLRFIMVYKVFKEIQKLLAPDKKPTVCTTMHGGTLPRAYFSIIGNTIVFLVLMVMFGCQVNKDNLVTGDYRLSVESAMLILALVTLPFYSLILFVLANAYWVMEMLISINLALGNSQAFQEDLKANFGTAVSDFVDYAVGKTDATQDRLQVLAKISTSKKFFYGLTELPVLILIFLWGCLVLMVVLLFSGFSDNNLNYGMKFLFLVTVAIANIHLTVVMMASIFVVAVFLVGALFYPIILPVCFRKKYAVNSAGQIYEV